MQAAAMITIMNRTELTIDLDSCGLLTLLIKGVQQLGLGLYCAVVVQVAQSAFLRPTHVLLSVLCY